MSGLLSFFGLSAGAGHDPIHNFWYGTPSRKTAAGVSVDEQVAMTYSVCWAATRLLSGTGGWIPFNLRRGFDGGGSEIAKGHLVHRLLHSSPNTEMASMPFRATCINQQVNWGNTFSEIERNAAGQPISLWPIHASRIPRKNIIRRNGRLVYRVRNDNGSVFELDQDDIFHVPSILTSDGIYGLGVVEHARLSIGFGIATETQGAAYMGNSARPTVVITGGKFKDKIERQEYRQMWEEVHGSPENNAKPAFLPPESTMQALSWSAEDSQFLATRQHNVEEIARWYGVPPHMVGHLLRSTNNNIEHQGIEFVKYSLLPWLKLWEQEVWRKLLTKAEQEAGYYAKFNVDALERGDKPSRTAANVQEFFNGLLTINQWAEREDMNPIGPNGDVHFVQQAMIPLEQAVKGPPKAGPAAQPEDDDAPVAPADDKPAEDDDEPELATAPDFVEALAALRSEFTTSIDTLTLSLRAKDEALEQSRATQQRLASAMLHDVMSRMVSLEVNAVKRVAEKPAKLFERLREFYDKHTVTLERSLAEPIAALLAASGDSREASVVVKDLAARHVAESQRQVIELCDGPPDEMPSRLELCVSRWHEERVEVVL